MRTKPDSISSRSTLKRQGSIPDVLPAMHNLAGTYPAIGVNKKKHARPIPPPRAKRMPCARDAGSVVPNSPACPGPTDGSIVSGAPVGAAPQDRDEEAGRLVHLPAGRDLSGAWRVDGMRRPPRPQARPEDSTVSDDLGVCAAMMTIGACLTAWTMSSLV